MHFLSFTIQDKNAKDLHHLLLLELWYLLLVSKLKVAENIELESFNPKLMSKDSL